MPRFSTLEKYCWDVECKSIEAFEKLDKFKKQQVKEDKERLKKKKKDLMSLSDHKKIAQHWFNKWIRYRDKGQPCISCGKELRQGNVDAGHYYSSHGHGNIRFHEYNVHAQCSRPCNKDLSGDPLNYQIGIEKRIGGEKLFELMAVAHDEKKWTRQELEEITEKYKNRCKEYERNNR